MCYKYFNETIILIKNYNYIIISINLYRERKSINGSYPSFFFIKLNNYCFHNDQ
jgi:hypothetical protein